MYRNMAEGAGLILLGLVVKGWSARGPDFSRDGVAADAEEINLVLL